MPQGNPKAKKRIFYTNSGALHLSASSNFFFYNSLRRGLRLEYAAWCIGALTMQKPSLSMPACFHSWAKRRAWAPTRLAIPQFEGKIGNGGSARYLS
jgi:hypothetical protein